MVPVLAPLHPQNFRFLRYGKPHHITKKEDEIIRDESLSFDQFVTRLASPMKITPRSVRVLRSLINKKNIISDTEYYKIGVCIALRVKNAKIKAKQRHVKTINFS